MPHGHGLTDFLYQRDERLLLLRSLTGGGRIGFVVCGAGGRYRPGIRARAAPAFAMKNGHCQIQIQPHRAKPGQYRFVERHNYSLSSSAQRGSGG